ncbi:MAG: hypothetical protein WCT52_00385 [Candidatus Micrarchaeia archaeon]
MRIIKKHEYWLPNRDRVIVEVLDVGNPLYKDGIMYTFRCMDDAGLQLFAIENSHGQPHVHRGAKKEIVDYGWKTAIMEFDNMVKAHREKITRGMIW